MRLAAIGNAKKAETETQMRNSSFHDVEEAGGAGGKTMQIRSVRAVYFSPTGTTKRTVEMMASAIAAALHVPWQGSSYTLPGERKENFHFGEDELLIWGTPVYAGRIPNKTLDFVKSAINGTGTPAIAIVVYGNRNYDQALFELTEIMQEKGFLPIGGVAVVARHTFSETLAAGRPDAADEDALLSFCSDVAEKIVSLPQNLQGISQVQIPGGDQPLVYYTPRKTDGTPAVFLKAKPKLHEEKCRGCGVCAEVCPMGCVSMEEAMPSAAETKDPVLRYPKFTGTCIKCQACIRSCSRKALYFDDEAFLSHVQMLEEHMKTRREPEVFL